MAAGLRCGSTTIKYLLFFFNFIFSLAGLAIVALGALGATQNNLGGTLDSTCIFLVVVGCIIFVTAFFGCCGAVRESNCMLVVFACLLMTIIVAEIVAAILIFVNLGGIENAVESVFKAARDNNDATAKESVDVLQKNLQCCGLKDASFWNGNIPDSCCAAGSKCTSNNSYGRGCESLFADALRLLGKALGAIAIAVAVVEVIGVWFALALAGEIKKLSR